jgi:hypothetical protein
LGAAISAFADSLVLGEVSFLSGKSSGFAFFTNGPMLDITSEDYTLEPEVQSYRSHATLSRKFLWVMDLRVVNFYPKSPMRLDCSTGGEAYLPDESIKQTKILLFAIL